VITVSRDHRKFLDGVLERSRIQAVTYQEVGLTNSQTAPYGYRHDHVTLPLGRGEMTWSRAQDAIRTWRAHRYAGITITPADAAIEEGCNVLASRAFGPLLLVAPCRIVYRTDTPRRFGFAYGTLPGHPEQGEEAFHVVCQEDGTVAAEVVAFSRPADLATKLAGPIAREIQKTVTRRYLQGIRQYVETSK
jgi:uncharacterized protein (UPF0548 family)